jgi:hypothetical protein
MSHNPPRLDFQRDESPFGTADFRDLFSVTGAAGVTATCGRDHRPACRLSRSVFSLH